MAQLGGQPWKKLDRYSLRWAPKIKPDRRQLPFGVLRPVGIEIRAGLHSGEVELRGADVGGIAVHIGPRVAGAADAGEVLVSRTVCDLVAGSGIEFEDRGEHELKGVPGTWRLFAVAA